MKINTLISLVLITFLGLSCSIEKDEDEDETASGTTTPTSNTDTTTDPVMPNLALAIETRFPKMQSTALRLATLPTPTSSCDSYSVEAEVFSCTTDHGGSFQRTFSFDPASIYFVSFIVDTIMEVLDAETGVTLGGAQTLTMPFLKDDDGEAITAEVTKTFSVDTTDALTETDQDSNQTFYIVLKDLKGGYSDTIFVASFLIQLYDSTDVSGNASIYQRFIFYGNIADGLIVKYASVGYEADEDATQGTVATINDTVPTGYNSGGNHLNLVVDADDNIKYRIGSGHASYNFSLVMGGTLDGFLLRKRVVSGSDAAGQFWAASFDETAKTFTDLGINDDTNSYTQITGGGTFSFDATDDVGFGNSLADELSTNFASLSFSDSVLETVKAENMVNFYATSDMPQNMSAITADWTIE